MRAARLPTLLVTGFWFAAGSDCAAGEVKFPKKSPLVSFQVPDTWTVRLEAKGGFPICTCTPDGPDWLAIRSLQETRSEADFRRMLPDLTRAYLAAEDLQFDFGILKFGWMTSRPLGNKIQAVYAGVRTVVLGGPYQLRVIGFTVDGHSMLIFCATDASKRKPGPDFDGILASFKPLK